MVIASHGCVSVFSSSPSAEMGGGGGGLEHKEAETVECHWE